MAAGRAPRGPPRPATGRSMRLDAATCTGRMGVGGSGRWRARRGAALSQVRGREYSLARRFPIWACQETARPELSAPAFALSLS